MPAGHSHFNYPGMFCYNSKMFIKIKVFPKAKNERIVKKPKDSLEIYVKEKAEQGKANAKILELLRKEFKEYNKIKIIKGHHSPSKIISLEKIL